MKSHNKKKIKPVFGEDGFAWVDSENPEPYDLVTLMRADGRMKNGWRQGKKWVGVRINAEDTFVKWKRLHSEPI